MHHKMPPDAAAGRLPGGRGKGEEKEREIEGTLKDPFHNAQCDVRDEASVV